MPRRYVISGFSKDKPGIVKQIAQSLYGVHANIEDASMTVIGGQFAFIMIAEMPSSAAVVLSRKLKKLSFSINPLSTPSNRVKKSSGVKAPYMISVIAKDHPGIVFHVSKTLLTYKVNITDLNAKVVSGKQGKKLYFLAIEAEIPAKADLKKIETSLRSVAKKQHLDISFHSVNQAVL